MRVNVYSEELTERVELIAKTSTDGRTHYGVRFWLHLPVTMPDGRQVRGPFLHHADDDDTAAVTFWGPSAELHHCFRRALEALRSAPDAAKGGAT